MPKTNVWGSNNGEDEYQHLPWRLTQNAKSFLGGIATESKSNSLTKSPHKYCSHNTAAVVSFVIFCAWKARASIVLNIQNIEWVQFVLSDYFVKNRRIIGINRAKKNNVNSVRDLCDIQTVPIGRFVKSIKGRFKRDQPGSSPSSDHKTSGLVFYFGHPLGQGDKINKTLRSVHFGVVVVELSNCKCGGIVRNEIW